MPDGGGGPESVGEEGGFVWVTAQFSKISGGRGADCWGEWLPSAREHPVDLREKGVYSSYTCGASSLIPDCFKPL